MTPKTVFWPLDCTKTGFCYGWDVPAFCVVGVLEGKDRRDAEGILETWNQKNNIKRPLRLLGLCHFTKERPSLMFEDAEDYHIVLYHRHVARSLRFYSLDVLKLDALERPANPRAQLINMHLEHDFTSSRLSAESGGISYRVVEQLNLAGSIDATLQPRKRILATIPTLILAFFTMIFTPVIPLLSSMGWILSVICNVPISFSWDALNLHYVVLKDVSATIQQLDVRAEQALFLAVEVVTLTHKAETPLAAYSARYTSFFNMIWLILNDITIGYAFGTFLSENAAILANLISRHAQHILIDWVQWVLRWLDSWPAGLKLNTELSWFYSHTLVDLVALWSSVLHRIFPYLPIIIRTFGLISSFGGMLGGLTMMISLFCDLLAGTEDCGQPMELIQRHARDTTFYEIEPILGNMMWISCYLEQFFSRYWRFYFRPSSHTTPYLLWNHNPTGYSGDATCIHEPLSIVRVDVESKGSMEASGRDILRSTYPGGLGGTCAGARESAGSTLEHILSVHSIMVPSSLALQPTPTTEMRLRGRVLVSNPAV
uniref:Uncharacterized protein n=1 Tax=Moniliophthora roreri TaxID=221103 RepID=A0A0W0F1A6_MONRR